MVGRRFRDPSLLDALELIEPIKLDTSLWRVTREGRDPCQCSKGGGRWDDTTFEVLYTSMVEEGAIAEMYFHLRRGQPIMPSKPVYRLHELVCKANNLLDLTDPSLLTTLGLNMSVFGKLNYAGRSAEYHRSQLISDAASYLGHDGIIVPNARWDAKNVVVFCDQYSIEVANESGEGVAIDWDTWRKRIGS